MLIQRTDIFGVPLDLLTMDQTVESCRKFIDSKQPVQHVVINAGKVVLMNRTPGLREIISQCDIINADGQSIVWGGRLLGASIPERVTGIDLMERLLNLSESEGWPVFILGARPAVLKLFESEVMRRFPKIKIAGRHDGYFSDDNTMVKMINASGARLLFVGISSPKKEFFLAKALPRMAGVFAMGVGGSFDIWAGEARRAPFLMQKVGLEWLFRLFQEPRRMWRRYLIGNTTFIWILIKELRVRRKAKRTPERNDTKNEAK